MAVEKAAIDELSGRTRGTAGDPTRETQTDFIGETLAWCAGLFGAARVRFIRPQDDGNWTVYTRQRATIVAHEADASEIAMAFTVGLGRAPLVVSRPRVSRVDGGGLRPIAMANYVGIPIVCQDRLIGVVELAGEMQANLEGAMHNAQSRLQRAGERLLHDRALRPRPRMTSDTICDLDSAFIAGGVTLTPDEFAFLAAIDGPTSVADAARAAELDEQRAIELAGELNERGLMSVLSES